MPMLLSIHKLIIKSAKSLEKKTHERKNSLYKLDSSAIYRDFFLLTTAEISLLLAAPPPSLDPSLAPSHSHRKDFLATILMRGRCYNTVRRNTHAHNHARPARHAGAPSSYQRGLPPPSPSPFGGRQGGSERVKGGREQRGGRSPPPFPLSLPSLSLSFSLEVPAACYTRRQPLARPPAPANPERLHYTSPIARRTERGACSRGGERLPAASVPGAFKTE